tara:strand:+ start:2133 stop:2339 length:207 start_codon:yes stop_codon:yes gene_type:complete
MSKKQKEQTITINEKEYKESDFNSDQVTMINHVSDLDRKINSSKFNLEQLQFGRDAFMDTLTKSLEES